MTDLARLRGKVMKRGFAFDLKRYNNTTESNLTFKMLTDEVLHGTPYLVRLVGGCKDERVILATHPARVGRTGLATEQSRGQSCDCRAKCRAETPQKHPLL